MSAQHEGCQFPLNGLRRHLVRVAVTTAILGQSMALVWWAGAITTGWIAWRRTWTAFQRAST